MFLLMAFLPHFARFLFLRGLGWSLQSPAQQNGRQQLRLCAEQHRAASAAEQPCKHSLPLLSVQDLFAGLSQCKAQFQPSCLLAQGVGKLTTEGESSAGHVKPELRFLFFTYQERLALFGFPAFCF